MSELPLPIIKKDLVWFVFASFNRSSNDSKIKLDLKSRRTDKKKTWKPTLKWTKSFEKRTMANDTAAKTFDSHESWTSVAQMALWNGPILQCFALYFVLNNGLELFGRYKMHLLKTWAFKIGDFYRIEHLWPRCPSKWAHSS